MNQDGLRGHRRHATSLDLDYYSSVRDRVYELVLSRIIFANAFDWILGPLGLVMLAAGWFKGRSRRAGRTGHLSPAGIRPPTEKLELAS